MEGVRRALYALPSTFKSEINISGVLVTDLQNFNSVLGASIEDQVAAALNTSVVRQIWDPDDQYPLYSFHRQPQTFPDVVLSTHAPGMSPRILMGIELKGWYVLAKEGVPTFRLAATPKVCEPQDIVAVFPWALSSATSGTPRLFYPYVESAQYVAAYRNWHWEFVREKKGSGKIHLSPCKTAYPSKADKIDDKPVDDGGGNFGRIARTGIMDAFIEEILGETLLGVPVRSWGAFLSIHKGGEDPAVIAEQVERLVGKLKEAKEDLSEEEIKTVRDGLLKLVEAIDV